jgi:ferredoxin
MKRLTVDRSVCVRSGQCSYLHPELFRADEDGSPIVLVEWPGEDLRAAAEEAAELCPSGAITLDDGIEDAARVR